jgi:lipopolysaccharide transport system ATP-binding protein
VAVFSQSELLDSVANIANWNVESGPNDIVGNRGYGACRLPVTVSVG